MGTGSCRCGRSVATCRGQHAVVKCNSHHGDSSWKQNLDNGCSAKVEITKSKSTSSGSPQAPLAFGRLCPTSNKRVFPLCSHVVEVQIAYPWGFSGRLVAILVALLGDAPDIAQPGFAQDLELLHGQVILLLGQEVAEPPGQVLRCSSTLHRNNSSDGALDPREE